MRIALVVGLLVACGDDRERAPAPPPTTTSAAPADARLAPPPPPNDAPLALAPHRFIRVNDFSEAPYPGWTAIEFPGLPAYDAATKRIAVGRVELRTVVQTQPNVEVWLLHVATKSSEKLPVWSSDESETFRGGYDRSPEKLRALVLAIDARITELEQQLASFTPIPKSCTPSDPIEKTWYPTCAGHEIWTCGDMVLRHPRTTRSGRREMLFVERGGKTGRYRVAGWIRENYRVPSTSGGFAEQEMIACIHDAWIVPGTTDVLVEVAHACNTSGDMCSAGGPSFEIVRPPT